MPQIITDFCSLFCAFICYKRVDITAKKSTPLYKAHFFLHELSTIQSKWEHSQMLGFTSNFYIKKLDVLFFLVREKIYDD